MAKYKITAPDGKQYIVSGGDVPPTQEQIRNLIAQQSTSTPDKKTFGDYFMDNLADIGYGAKKALSGATFGASDWALRRLGLDNEKEYLARKEAEGLGTLTKGLGFASEIGGNITGAGGKLLGALGKAGLKGLPLALAAGGIEGGAYGLTSSDTLQETPENFLTGIVGGTIGGALGEGAGRLLSKGLRGARSFFSNNPNKASGGALGGLVDDVAENIGNRPQAEKLVNEALDKAQSSGRSLIEVADDSIVDVAQKARQKTPEARYILSTKLNQAREAQPIELRNYINDTLGTSSRGESVGEVTRLAQERARPIYDRLNDMGDLAAYEKQKELSNLVQNNNLIKDTIRQAKNSRSAIKDLPDTDFRVINDARSKLSEVTQSLDKSAAYDARQALKELDPVLDDIIPEYAQARRAYTEAHKFDEAGKLGETIFNNKINPIDFNYSISKFSPAERDALAIGIRDEILAKVGSTQNPATGVSKLMTQNVQDKMRYALGDDVANSIVNKAEEAVKLNQNYNKLLQGSQTSEKQGLRDYQNMVMNVLRNPAGILGELVNPFSKTMQNLANIRLANALTSNDIGALRNGLNYYNSLRNAYNINPIYGISTGAQLGKYLAEEF